MSYIPAFMRRRAKNYLLRTLPEYGYELVSVRDRNPWLVGNQQKDDLIICNFCGTIFRRSGNDHPEGLNCIHCDTIARERVAFQCILDEVGKRTGTNSLFFRRATQLKPFTMLECSPRHNQNRREIYEETLGKYYASDFDMMAHMADIKLDLTSDEDVQPFMQAFDIILCAHVLEHIPDYRKALINLRTMLSPDGFLVLQVPLLENAYVPVTWDEFHQDNTRVFHRFGFDLINDLKQIFNQVTPVVGLLDFHITSPEIKPEKYLALQHMREQVVVFGESKLRCNGFGNPDLCDAFIAYK